jgi:hypothetical protein
MPAAMNAKESRSGTWVAATRAQRGALGAKGFAINPIEACAKGSIKYIFLMNRAS